MTNPYFEPKNVKRLSEETGTRRFSKKSCDSFEEHRKKACSDTHSIPSTIRDANDFYVVENRTFQYDSHYTLHIVGKFPFKSKAFVTFLVSMFFALCSIVWTALNYHTKSVEHGSIDDNTEHDSTAPVPQHLTDEVKQELNRKKSTLGGLMIGIFLFIAICSMVLAFEERDDNDQYIQIGDIYTQVIEAYNRRTNKGGKSNFNAANMKYHSNRFQMTPIINGNIVTRKQFKQIRDAQRQLIKEQETKPVLHEEMKSGLFGSSNSGSRLNGEFLSTGSDNQRVMNQLRRRSNASTKVDPMQNHVLTQNERTKEWVKRNVNYVDSMCEIKSGYKGTPVVERKQLVPR